MPSYAGYLNTHHPIEWGHPDNAGLALWLLGINNFAGGQQWPDLTGRTSGASLVGGPAWVGSPYGQSALASTGTQYSTTVAVEALFGSAPVAVSVAWWQYVSSAGPSSGAMWGGVAGGGELSAQFFGGTWFVGSRAPGSYGDIRLQLASDSASAPAGWSRYYAYVSLGLTALYRDGRVLASRSDSGTVLDLSSSGPMRLNGNPAFGSPLVGTTGGWRLVANPFGDPAGLAARDYEWSQDPGRDPRLRRLSSRAWLIGTGGGGTTTPETFTASCTPSATLTLLVTKSLTGSCTPAGAIAKLAAKVLTASSQPAGAVVKQAGKPLVASCAATAAVVKQVAKPLAASETPIATLAKQAQKPFSASCEPTGNLLSLAKLTTKSFAAGCTPAGSLVALRAVFRSFTGSVGAAVSLVRRVLKVFTGSVTSSGELTTSGGSALATGGRRDEVPGRGIVGILVNASGNRGTRVNASDGSES